QGRRLVARQAHQKLLDAPAHLDRRLGEQGDQHRHRAPIAGGEQSLDGAEANTGVDVGEQTSGVGPHRGVGGTTAGGTRRGRAGTASLRDFTSSGWTLPSRRPTWARASNVSSSSASSSAKGTKRSSTSTAPSGRRWASKRTAAEGRAAPGPRSISAMQSLAR